MRRVNPPAACIPGAQPTSQEFALLAGARLCVPKDEVLYTAARANAEHFQAPLEFTDTAICMDICAKSAKMFQVLGLTEQQHFAQTLWSEFRAAARKYLIDLNTKTAKARCQTTQAMAIWYDIFDEAEKPAAFQRLLDIIHNDGDAIYCGVLGGECCSTYFRPLGAPTWPSG